MRCLKPLKWESENPLPLLIFVEFGSTYKFVSKQAPVIVACFLLVFFFTENLKNIFQIKQTYSIISKSK